MNFRCLCKPGYKPHHSNHLKCVDFDECAEMTAHCPSNSNCINRNGSYECKCNPGFVSKTSNQDISSLNESFECVPSKDISQVNEKNGTNGSKTKKKKKRKKKVLQIQRHQIIDKSCTKYQIYH